MPSTRTSLRCAAAGLGDRLGQASALTRGRACCGRRPASTRLPQHRWARQLAIFGELGDRHGRAPCCPASGRAASAGDVPPRAALEERGIFRGWATTGAARATALHDLGFAGVLLGLHSSGAATLERGPVPSPSSGTWRAMPARLYFLGTCSGPHRRLPGAALRSRGAGRLPSLVNTALGRPTRWTTLVAVRLVTGDYAGATAVLAEPLTSSGTIAAGPARPSPGSTMARCGGRPATTYSAASWCCWSPLSLARTSATGPASGTRCSSWRGVGG